MDHSLALQPYKYRYLQPTGCNPLHLGPTFEVSFQGSHRYGHPHQGSIAPLRTLLGGRPLVYRPRTLLGITSPVGVVPLTHSFVFLSAHPLGGPSLGWSFLGCGPSLNPLFRDPFGTVCGRSFSSWGLWEVLSILGPLAFLWVVLPRGFLHL